MPEQRSTAITDHAPFDGVDPDIYLPGAGSGRNGRAAGHPHWMRRVPILGWFLA